MNVVRVDVLFATSGYVKVDLCSVRQTADGMVFHHARFFDASLHQFNGKEVQFQTGALARIRVDERHCFLVVENVTASAAVAAATTATTFLLMVSLLRCLFFCRRWPLSSSSAGVAVLATTDERFL